MDILQKNLRKVCLQTPRGDIFVPVEIEHHTTEDALTEENAESMSVRMHFNGELFYASCSNYPWMKAFSDIQGRLPQGVTLKCCLSCRHGNMCPVGNAPFELFCTKDVLITRVEDLWDYTETEEETTKRSREYTDVCADYQEQTHDYCTYNDYQSYEEMRKRNCATTE